ncbi:hypothetical protein IH575_00330 [Candidatus Dojkabacteria bacterium]|nr:hypothetical protein [Candidatus Dojkabacteria bacterium]
MNKILKVNVPEYGEGAYIIYSASQRDMAETQGEFRVQSHVSFAYVDGDYAAEFEPQYGPIQTWHKCDELALHARKHYIFDYTDSGGMNWSQLAVDRAELPWAVHRGEWQYVFDVLKDWCKR